MLAELVEVCAICGRVHTDEVDVESDILHAIAYLERTDGKAETNAVADKVGLSPSQTRRYLTDLQKQGRLKRVGYRAGWHRRTGGKQRTQASDSKNTR